MEFVRSETGAQSAWKGFTSQTLYIASRIAAAEDKHEYFPEQLEDLLIKLNGEVIEIVQIKDHKSPLTLSDLASVSDSSEKNEGFFRRVLSQRKSSDQDLIIKVTHFGPLGEELAGFSTKQPACITSIKNKLVNSHKLTEQEANWFIERWVFEKVDSLTLHTALFEQIKQYVPTMVAPNIAQDLLVYYVFDLSKRQGSISKAGWQERIMRIGTDMAAMDGYFREYGAALIRLAEIISSKSAEELTNEFLQGIATHPGHLRLDLDFERSTWLNQIEASFKKELAVIVKGASGQGKTALCYRYLIKHYPEELVFCVRHIQSSLQAENLAKAIIGLSKHCNGVVLYIDVNPGEYQWAWLLRELQARGTSVPVLISIREEDFKLSNVDMSEVAFQIVELELYESEAKIIYESLTERNPHDLFRSFDEAWQRFGRSGPFLEFVYLLNNNETLKQRLEVQIERLIHDPQCSDSWINLLNIISYAGKIGCPVLFEEAKRVVQITNFVAALDRMTKEYLVRSSDDGRFIEILHPLRGSIINDILHEKIMADEEDILLLSIECVESRYLQMLLMYYFTYNEYQEILIHKIAGLNYRDWDAYSNALNAMLWLDVKLYVERNAVILNRLFAEKGIGWSIFSPLDVSGKIRPGVYMAESLVKIHPQITVDFEKIKQQFSSDMIGYNSLNIWIATAKPPKEIPESDSEWSSMGYSLFWLAQQDQQITMPIADEEIIIAMHKGSIECKVDAVCGIFSQNYIPLYQQCELILRERIIKDNQVIWINISESIVECEFVPPYFRQESDPEKHKNINHYWTMYMVNLLGRLYPQKDEISVKLIGVDLFKEIGVETFDCEKRIPKENRPDQWITKINSWFNKRVDLMHRPAGWKPYLEGIMSTRYKTVETLNELITIIDRLYKRKQLESDNAKSIVMHMNKLNTHLVYKHLLPETVVDPYGLNSEGSTDQTEFLPKSISLATQPYDYFRRSLQQTSSSIQNFCRQYIDILIERVKGEIKSTDNTHLSVSNVYEAAKSLWNMQKEHNRLFSGYIDKTYMDFEIYEEETILTLLNVWGEVLNQKPQGYILSYDAKQAYRKTKKKVSDAFLRVIGSMEQDVKVFDLQTQEDKGTKYLVFNYQSLAENEITSDYFGLCLVLRKAWSFAQMYNSCRWYLETQWPQMVFVPLYQGLPVLGAYNLPLYRVLSVNEDNIDSIMYPSKTPEEIYAFLGIESKSFISWMKKIANIGQLRFLLIQYNQVLAAREAHLDVAADGIANYLKLLNDDLTECMEQMSEDLIIDYDKTICDEDLEIEAQLMIIMEFGKNLLEEIQLLQSLEPVDKAPELAQQIIAGLVLLAPKVVALPSVNTVDRG